MHCSEQLITRGETHLKRPFPIEPIWPMDRFTDRCRWVLAKPLSRQDRNHRFHPLLGIFADCLAMLGIVLFAALATLLLGL